MIQTLNLSEERLSLNPQTLHIYLQYIIFIHFHSIIFKKYLISTYLSISLFFFFCSFFFLRVFFFNSSSVLQSSSSFILLFSFPSSSSFLPFLLPLSRSSLTFLNQASIYTDLELANGLTTCEPARNPAR